MANLKETLPENLLKAIKEHSSNVGFDTKDLNIKVVQGSKKGDSFVSYVKRILVRGKRVSDGSEANISMIAKVAPTSSFLREINNVTNLYLRETFIYNVLLPEFRQFQQRHTVVSDSSQSDISKIYPECINNSTETNSEFMLLEDICEQGFVNFERTKGMDFFSCKQILHTLAKLHAISFVFLDKDRDRFHKILQDNLRETIFVESVTEGMETMLQNKVNHVIESIKSTKPEEGDELIYKKLEQFKTNFAKIMSECCNAKDYPVICHGDAWICNLMYKIDGNSNMEVKLIDFQMSRFTTPLLDVSYFLVCCTERNLRPRLQELLDHYYTVLIQEINQMGSDGPTLFPYEKFQEHCQKYMKFGIGMALMTLHVICCDQDSLPDPAEAFTSYQKLKQIELEITKNPVYIQRISDVCRDMARLGYL